MGGNQSLLSSAQWHDRRQWTQLKTHEIYFHTSLQMLSKLDRTQLSDLLSYGVLIWLKLRIIIFSDLTQGQNFTLGFLPLVLLSKKCMSHFRCFLKALVFSKYYHCISLVSVASRVLLQEPLHPISFCFPTKTSYRSV